MRVFKSTWFSRFARKERIADIDLCKAVLRASEGSVDANLGNGLIKQRIARPGSGRSGGYRTIIVFQTKARAVFVFGFAKSSRANLSDAEEAVFKKAAILLLRFSENEIGAEVASGRLTEVQCNGEDI